MGGKAGGGGRSGGGARTGGAGGGTIQGGFRSGDRLANGVTQGESIDATRNSFQVGDFVISPSTPRSSGFRGTITRIGRTRFDVEVGYMNRTLTLENISLSDLSNGYRVRNNVMSVVR